MGLWLGVILEPTGDLVDKIGLSEGATVVDVGLVVGIEVDGG